MGCDGCRSRHPRRQGVSHVRSGVSSVREIHDRGRHAAAGLVHNRVASYTGSAALLDGHLYLVDSKGILKCVDWNTGLEKWVQRGFDERGTLIATDGKLLIQTGASGQLVIVAADSVGYRQLRQTKVFDDNPET
jgi:hypothetical protein